MVAMFVSLAALAGGSSAAAIDGPMRSVSIDGTDLFIDYPSHWEAIAYPLDARAFRSWLEQYPEAASLVGISPDASKREIKKLLAQDLKYQVLLRS